jgi:hypothetical protein
MIKTLVTAEDVDEAAERISAAVVSRRYNPAIDSPASAATTCG